ncbi:DegT/DnrJ/EryC1/StrS family aminotransferase [Streptomyces actuosus]|uniref:Aminotransferase DegT n=1 Tax=Streptomyces actuosus TaxID=1885 RepID=A0A2U9PC93_STRAS|nr:aminotransferase DegT [Streptomyces actuosus]MBM4823497.1 DegT/DnrJ/EryC1/StrS family aminotransferase [Streptomyces actuosus]
MRFETRLTATDKAGLPATEGQSADIPFFSQAQTFERLWPAIEKGLEDVFLSGKFSHGKQVGHLESALAAYTGARHVIGVNSGTDALVLLLRACGLRPGDGVLVPAYSFFATASAVVLAGGRPQFVDIDPETYAMDPVALEAAVTDSSRFVMQVHLFHTMADLEAVTAVARRHGLTVVEDSAEAIGMRRGGVHAGLHGAGGVLSFFPSKTLGALGDAGAVLTDDPEVAGTVAALRHHGRPGRTLNNFPAISTDSVWPGVNSKMDDIQAAVLLAKLPLLEEQIEHRAALADAYTARLKGTPGILRLPRTTAQGPGDRDVFYVYLIEVEDRDALVDHLDRHGIGTEVYYPLPLPHQPAFAGLGHRPGDFPNAEAASRHAVALPFHADLDTGDVDRVCDTVRSFLAARRTAV